MKRAYVLPGIAAGILAGFALLSLWRSGAESASVDPRVDPSGPRFPSSGAEGLAPPGVPEAGRQTIAGEPAPVAEEDLVTIRIVAAKSYARDAERIPGIAFEVLATRLEIDFVSSPMTTAPVLPDDPPLHAGRTGDDGEARIELPVGSFAQDAHGRPGLRVRVVEPGHQQRIGGPVAREDGAIELRAIVVPGATARGRVVDASGAGVMADVRLREWQGGAGVSKLGGGAGTRALAGGWFELDLREDVAGGVLVADAGDRGTGTLRDVSLSLAAPEQELEIVVGGSGRLRGRVTDADGFPAASLELLVWYAAFDDESGRFVSPEPEYSRLRAQGGGRLWVTLATDAGGRFDVGGLRAAPYVIRARTGQDRSSGYPILLTPEAVSADGAELALELSRPHLAVRIRNADGSAWQGPEVQVREQGVWADRVVEWPEVPTLMVYPCTPAGEEEVVQGELLEGRVAVLDVVVYEVPDGARYLVGAMGGGFRGELTAVAVPPGAGRVPVELFAPVPRELGSVSVRVVFEGRELDGRTMSEPDFDVYLESLDTGAVLLSREEYGDPAPFVLTAPAGRYRVVAEGAPFVDTHHGVLLTERVLGRAEVELDLVAGQTLDLPVELERGGRLEVTLEGETTDDDLGAVVEEYAFLGEPGREDERSSFAARARLYLVRPARRPEPVQTTVEWTGTSSAGTHLEPLWPLGATNVSQVLPTGRYRLVARMPGGREVAAEVEVAPDETRKVRLAF